MVIILNGIAKKMARSTVIDFVRYQGAKKRGGLLMQEDLIAPILEALGFDRHSPSLIEKAVIDERNLALQEVIESLPSRDQEILSLRIRDELSWQDIGQKVGLTKPRNRFYEIRKTMLRLLESKQGFTSWRQRQERSD